MQKMVKAIKIIVLTLLLLAIFTRVNGATPPKLWLWFSGHASEALSEINEHKNVIDQISFGGYSVTANGTFAGGANVTLIKQLKSFGIESWPLIGCGSTETLRALMSNPDNFISSAVQEIENKDFQGYNIDFEPYDGKSTNQDGINYGIFLNKFANALHKVNKKLSVDYFSNLPIWNLGAMNSSSTDYFISMDTYVQENSTFEAYLNIAQSKFNGKRIGVGMCAGTRPPPYTPYGPDPCPINAWTEEQLEERFQYLDNLIMSSKKTGSDEMPFSQINMWVLPVGDSWWKKIEIYFNRWGNKL